VHGALHIEGPDAGHGGGEPFGSAVPGDPHVGSQDPHMHAEPTHHDAGWWQPSQERHLHHSSDDHDHHDGAELAHG